MKRLFMHCRSEQGFILPYTLVVCTMVIIAIISLITMYENELQMTERLKQQLYVETIMQMLPYDIEADLHVNDWEVQGLPIEYNYEYGSAKIHKVEVEEDLIHFHVGIKTESLSYSYTFVLPPELVH